MEKILEVLDKYNRLPDSVISTEGQARLQRSLEQEGLVEFGVFTCPPINARLLLSNNPEEYVLTDPAKNNLEKSGSIQLVNKLFRGLSTIGINARLRVIIGDTDEDDYYFPVIPPPPSLENSLCEARKVLYAANLTNKLQQIFPWTTTVDRYSEIDALFDEDLPSVDLTDNQTQQDLATEFQQMKQLFSSGCYYEGLPTPTDEELKQIVDLKFQTYGRQGVRLAEFFPNMVLIQNEFPLTLRTRMLNLLTAQLGRERLPAFYPFPDRNRK